MPIEDIFSIQGRGTVVTGRIERGKVKVGEEVEIVGFRDTRKTVVTGVEMFKKQLDEGMAGDNAGLLLRGIAKEDVERGMVLAKRWIDHAAHQVQGRSLHPDKRRRWAAYAILQGIPSAILSAHDGCDRRGRTSGGYGDGDARGQREPGDRTDHPGGDGEGLALCHSRRRAHGRRGNHCGDCAVSDGSSTRRPGQRPGSSAVKFLGPSATKTSPQG